MISELTQNEKVFIRDKGLMVNAKLYTYYLICDLESIRGMLIDLSLYVSLLRRSHASL